MQIFQALGATIEASFRAAGYDELAFPKIAARALREARIPEKIGVDDVLRWLLTAASLPDQTDINAKFAEPPVSVYHGQRFEVQVLFWYTSSTTIHGHGLSGAFQVLSGASVQNRYAFRARRRINSHFQIGDVRLVSSDLLRRGDVVEVDHNLLHNVFHLDAPSASVVVRTYSDPDRHPQFNYLPPSLAVDPFYDEPITKRRLQGLAFMIRTAHPEYEARARDIIATTELQTCFKVLEQANARLADRALVARLMAAAADRHGPVVSELEAALDHHLFRRKLHRLREVVLDREQRYFLALLQGLPDKEAIYAAIRRDFPGEAPQKRVERWVLALSGVDRIGVDLTDDLNRVLFTALLEGRSKAALRARLNAEFDAETVAAQASAIERYVEQMRKTALAPLFRRRG